MVAALNIDRRQMVAGAMLCAVPLKHAHAAISPDPVFGAIETHSKAFAALKLADAAEAGCDAAFGSPSQEKAADVAYHAFCAEQDAIEALMRTAATSREGLAAWSAYLIAQAPRFSGSPEPGEEGEVRGQLVLSVLEAVRRFSTA